MATISENLLEGRSDTKYVSNRPLTTDLVEASGEGILSNAIDSKIVKIRPMATPLDQISRLGHVRRVDSMEVDYYSVDTRPDRSEIEGAEALEAPAEGGSRLSLTLSDPGIVEVSDVLTVKDSAGTFHGMYVCAKNDNKVEVLLADKVDATRIIGCETMRMGRAATQLDVQSPQFAVLPHRNTNFCQIFKQQVEQSVVLRDSHKNIGWEFTDQQEAAIFDMRLGMEKQFLFGKKMKIYDPVKGENVNITGGIWHQAGKAVNLTLSKLDDKGLVDLLRKAFAENSGSRRKVLLAGSGLIAAINKLEASRVVHANDSVTKWGLDFSEICSKFGRLYVIFSDIFDLMDRPQDGMIIDPEYIQKHVFIPFRADRLDLRGSGQRNTEAIVLTEASCLTLRYPNAHMRINGV